MPQAKLRELVATLLHYRNELELQRRSAAQASAGGGNKTLVTSAERLVRTQQQIIRDHCQLSGLPLPANVPTAVPTAVRGFAR